MTNSTFRKAALSAAVLALMAGPALAAQPGADTATGSQAPAAMSDTSGSAQNSAIGAAERDKRGNSYSGTAGINANANVDTRSNNQMKGQVDGSAAGGITK